MPQIDPVFLFAALAAFALAVLGILRRRSKLRLAIERKPFLTKAELDMLAILRRVLSNRHISCQVSMGALLKPRKGLGPKEFWRTRNKFGQKIVDYVVIDPATGFVQAVIELDDSSHDPDKDRQRDAMLAKGHYRVVRIPSKPKPTDQNVRERLAEIDSLLSA